MTTLPLTELGTPILAAIAAGHAAAAANQPPPEPPCPLQVGDQVVLPQAVLQSIGHRSERWLREHRPAPPIARPVGHIGTVWSISHERRCATVMIEVAFPGRDDEPMSVSVDVRLDRLERVERVDGEPFAPD